MGEGWPLRDVDKKEVQSQTGAPGTATETGELLSVCSSPILTTPEKTIEK